MSVVAVEKPDDRESIFDAFVTDRDLEDDGVWRMIDGHKFKIAALNNPRHNAVLSNLPEATLRAYQSAELPDDEFRQLHARIVAEGLLRGWDERFREPFSPAIATDLLAKAPHLTGKIIAIAQRYQNYLLVDRGRDSKN